MSFFDTRETRDPVERERDLFARLPGLITDAKAKAPGWAALLADVDPLRVDSRAALAQLPVLRKSELLERQKAARPFGGFATVGWGEALRVFASPGPLYEPEGRGADHWRLARALHAAGFRAGELIHNGFSYHLTPAGAMLESAAHALNCAVFPGGVGQTEQQVQAMADLRPAGYVGTPSFLKIILERADELGVALPSLAKALVSGEAFPPALRDWLAGRGVAALQAYATADAGLIAYETPARKGLILEEDVILEIVRPGSGDPLPEGEVGEVVVTVFNAAYPLIRFGTGDLSAVLPGASPCGRTNTRIRGWLGRADQTAKVRGMFVHPAQVAEIARRHPDLRRLRLVIDNPQGADRMRLLCEATSGSEALVQALAVTLREVTRLRGEVELCALGTLPNDGRLIEDARRYE